ncbi:hypothetical protein CSE899_12616 [Cronobacter sakazakii E899]|nr:hypothetical protein CSE899_12616 [Cronobacter sakazakii E899]
MIERQRVRLLLALLLVPAERWPFPLTISGPPPLFR